VRVTQKRPKINSVNCLIVRLTRIGVKTMAIGA
jgi:hypothetical protein